MTQMTPRSRLGLQLLMLLAGVLVGLAVIALHCAWLSLYSARPKLLSGDIARELVWLNLPFAATVLGLLAARTKTVVAPLVGVTLGIIAGSFIAAAVPEAHLLPLPRGLLSAPVTLACVIAFLAIMIGLASTAAWIDRGQGLSWLNYGAAAGYAFFLALVMMYSRKVVLPPGGGPWSVATGIFGVFLSGLLVGALVGGVVAIWAGTFVGLVGQVIYLNAVADQTSNLFPLVLIGFVIGAGFAFPGGYLGEQIRKLVLGSQASTTF